MGLDKLEKVVNETLDYQQWDKEMRGVFLCRILEDYLEVSRMGTKEAFEKMCTDVIAEVWDFMANNPEIADSMVTAVALMIVVFSDDEEEAEKAEIRDKCLRSALTFAFLHEMDDFNPMEFKKELGEGVDHVIKFEEEANRKLETFKRSAKNR